MKRLSIGLFILFLPTSLSLLNAAAAFTSTLTVDTSPMAGITSEVDVKELAREYSGRFIADCLALLESDRQKKVSALRAREQACYEESRATWERDYRDYNEAYRNAVKVRKEHNKKLQADYDELCDFNEAHGLALPVKPVAIALVYQNMRDMPHLPYFEGMGFGITGELNGVEGCEAFSRIVSPALQNNNAFLRELREQVAQLFQEVIDQGKGTLRYVRFLINKINEQLVILEGCLSPQAHHDMSEYSLFAPDSVLTVLPEGEYLDDKDALAVSVTGERRSAAPGALTAISVDPLVLNQHEERFYSRSCAFFSLFNALCYVNELEGSPVAALQKTNFDEFKRLYSIWEAIIVEASGGRRAAGKAFGCSLIAGLNMEEMQGIYRRIIDGSAGIESLTVREAFKKHVIFMNEIASTREENEPLTQTYLRFRYNAAGGGNVTHTNMVAAIEAFRKGSLRYLIAIHGALGARWNFGDEDSSEHATAVLYRRQPNNATHALIADTDIGTYNRTVIKHFYREVLSNGHLPQEESDWVVLKDLTAWREQLKPAWRKGDPTEKFLSAMHEASEDMEEIILKYELMKPSSRTARLSQGLERLIAVSPLIQSGDLLNSIEQAYNVMQVLFVTQRATDEQRINQRFARYGLGGTPGFMLSTEKLLDTLEIVQKISATATRHHVIAREVVRFANVQIQVGISFYKERLKKLKDMLNTVIEKEEIDAAELDPYRAFLSSNVDDLSLTIGIPERFEVDDGGAAVSVPTGHLSSPCAGAGK